MPEGFKIADAYVEAHITGPSEGEEATAREKIREGLGKTDTKSVGEKKGKEFSDNLFKTLDMGAKNALFPLKLTIGGIVGGAMGQALSAVGAGVTQMIGQVAPAVPALAVIPASMFAVAQASFVAKLGLDDFTKAVGGDAKALKSLPPEVRNVAKSIGEMKDELKQTVQGALFERLGGPIQALAKNYMPVLRDELTQTAGALNYVARQAIAMANTPTFRADFATILAGNTNTIANFGQAGLSLVSVLRDLLVTVQPLQAEFSAWIARMAAGIADMVNARRESGALAAMWARAGEVAKQLGRIIGNVGLALFRTFSIGARQQVDMLTNLEQLTQRWAQWTGSITGRNAIADWFRRGNETGRAFAHLLSDFTSQMKGAFNTVDLVRLINLIDTRLVPSLANFFNKLNSQGALEHLIVALSQILDIMAGSQGLTAFATVIGGAVSALARLNSLLPGVSGLMFGFFGVWKALSMIGLAGPIRAAVTSMVAFMTAEVTANGATTTRLALMNATLVSYARQTVAMVASRIAMVASAAATAAVTAATWLWNAALLANPIGLVIIAIVALVAGIIYAYKHFETFRNIVNAVWNGIKAVTVATWHVIVAAVTGAVNGIRSAISVGMRAISAVWRSVWGTFGPLVKAVWNLIKSIVTLALTAVLVVMKLQLTAAKNVFMAAWNAIKTVTLTVWNAIKNAVISAVNAIKGPVSSAANAVRNAISSAWNAVMSITRNVWSSITSFVGNRISAVRNSVSSGVSPIGRIVGNAFSSAYNGARSALSRLFSLAGTIRNTVVRAVGNLGSVLWNAGAAIISGLISGISSQINRLAGYLNNIKNWIGQWKGPIEDDARILVPHGQVIIGGLIQGLKLATPNLRDALQDVSKQIAATPIAVPGTAGVGVSPGGGVGTGAGPFSPALASGAANGVGGRPLHIENLTLHVQGIVDPRDATAWRDFISRIRKDIRSVERQYL